MFLTNKSIFPAFKISFGSSLLFVCLIVLLPMSAFIIQLSEMSWSQYLKVIIDPPLIRAYRITFISAMLASFCNAFFGILISWVLVRYRFPGRLLLDGLIDLPFILPTAVAGLTLSSLFSETGWYGMWFTQFGIKISYTWLGIVIAMIFTSMPFVIRMVQPVLAILDREYEEAAQVLGASGWQIFRSIIFPELFPTLIIGTVLSFIRSLGEFGAVIFISGNIIRETEVISLMIFIKLQEFDYPAASAIASVILAISLLLLCLVNIIQHRFKLRLTRN